MSHQDHSEGRRDWPFEILPQEKRSEQHQQEIAFLEAAYREGHKAYLCSAGDLGATAEERSGLIVVRGRMRWEIVLATLETKMASAFVDDFACASQAVLDWLRGADAATILSRVERHLVLMPGAAHSFLLDAIPKSQVR